MNQNVVSDGALATAALAFANTKYGPASNVTIGGASASDGNGKPVTVIASGATVTITPPPTEISASLTCSPSTVTVPTSTSCTVALSAATPTGITAALGYAANGATLSIPGSVTIPAGSNQGSYTAQAIAANANTTVAMTATLNGGHIDLSARRGSSSDSGPNASANPDPSANPDSTVQTGLQCSGIALSIAGLAYQARICGPRSFSQLACLHIPH